MNEGITNVMGKSNNDTNSRRASKLCGRKMEAKDKLLLDVSTALASALDTAGFGICTGIGADRNHELIRSISNPVKPMKG